MELLFGKSEHKLNQEKFLVIVEKINNIKNGVKDNLKNYLFELLEYYTEDEISNFLECVKNGFYNKTKDELSTLVSNTTSYYEDKIKCNKLIESILSCIKDCSNIVGENYDILFILNAFFNENLLSSDNKNELEENINIFLKEYLLKKESSFLQQLLIDTNFYKKIVESKERRKKDIIEMKEKSCVKDTIIKYSFKTNKHSCPTKIIHTKPITVPVAFEKKMEKIHKEKTLKTADKHLRKFKRINWNLVSRDENLIEYIHLLNRLEFYKLDKDIIKERCLMDEELNKAVHIITKKFE